MDLAISIGGFVTTKMLGRTEKNALPAYPKALIYHPIELFIWMQFLDMFFEPVRTHPGITKRAFLQAYTLLVPVCFFDVLIQARLGD
jgi:hypothetical protein